MRRTLWDGSKWKHVEQVITGRTVAPSFPHHGSQTTLGSGDPPSANARRFLLSTVLRLPSSTRPLLHAQELERYIYRLQYLSQNLN